jgi:hypothetical protein
MNVGDDLTSYFSVCCPFLKHLSVRKVFSAYIYIFRMGE